jgi:nicotinate-nucleotide adenylyltransferase
VRIGILGGTFDPPHEGHLALARAALKSLQLDEVLFLPAHRNPLKRGARQSPPTQRLEMVRLAVEGEPGLAVCDIEIARRGLSYAVDTLEQLHLVRPAHYWFILGGDAVQQIGTWRRPDKLLRMCRLAVAPRPPERFEDVVARLPPDVRARADPIELSPVNISSSEIRDRLARRIDVSAWVPKNVLQYIRENRLYRG